MKQVHYRDENGQVYGYRPQGLAVTALSTDELTDFGKGVQTHEAVMGCIKSIRTERMSGGFCLEYDGKTLWFNSDERSRMQQLTMANHPELIAEGLQWKTLANDYVTMTPELAKAIVEAAVAHEAAVFACAEGHRTAVMALNDPSDYDSNGGWPESYTEWVQQKQDDLNKESTTTPVLPEQSALLGQLAETLGISQAELEARLLPNSGKQDMPDTAVTDPAFKSKQHVPVASSLPTIASLMAVTGQAQQEDTKPL